MLPPIRSFDTISLHRRRASIPVSQSTICRNKVVPSHPRPSTKTASSPHSSKTEWTSMTNQMAGRGFTNRSMEIQVIHSLKATDTLSRLVLHFSLFVPCCIHILKLYNSRFCLSAKLREILRNSDCCIILPSVYLLRALSLQRCFDDSEEQWNLCDPWVRIVRFDDSTKSGRRSVRLFTFRL